MHLPCEATDQMVRATNIRSFKQKLFKIIILLNLLGTQIIDFCEDVNHKSSKKDNEPMIDLIGHDHSIFL